MAACPAPAARAATVRGSFNIEDAKAWLAALVENWRVDGNTESFDHCLENEILRAVRIVNAKMEEAILIEGTANTRCEDATE